MDKQTLLSRLDEIGKSLERSGHALALIGLGSVGLDTNRMDAWSDLDFFAIVETGYKQEYIQDLSWLSALGPLAYTFRNTVDGYKVLYADGVFCEFAVFEPDELETAVYAPGRLVWKQPQVPESWSRPARQPQKPDKSGKDWLVGEALTCLYVGLGRELRGEKLTAHRYIQNHAVDRVLELMEDRQPPQSSDRDPFDINRRFEQRLPAVAGLLPTMLQGYHHNRESALAILAFLEMYYEVNPAVAVAIRERAV
jgi:hypothetical protein